MTRVDPVELARALRTEIAQLGLGQPPASQPPSPSALAVDFDQLVTDPDLRACSSALFRDGYHAQAVFEACKCVNNFVKYRSGLSAQDGASLMRSAFSPKDPVLRLNDLRSQSKRDEQQGYMDVLAGVMTGVRNPRAHEHTRLDDPDVAVKLLGMLDHLMAIARSATRTRRRKAKSP